MNEAELIKTAKAMVADNKGLLAMDESNPTCNKRFAALGIPQTAEMRRRYREMIVTTPRLKEGVNGAILYDETVRQKLSDGTPFVEAVIDAGIIPGIKVDMGAKELAGFPGEKITAGLDGLRERLSEYSEMGLRFAKWRAVLKIGDSIPTRRCIENNAIVLARYAALCQEAGLVPMVEPEVLMEGKHDLKTCLSVTEQVLHIVFDQLHKQRILAEGMILKPNMILPGSDCSEQSSTDEIAETTVKCLLRCVPASVVGVAFLSGGQSSKLATERLNAMNKKYKPKMPWALVFSFSRALQHPSIDIWNGKEENIEKAQQALHHRVKLNAAACRGEYKPDMEK
ncbi:class I fructose-bisphosphate aldolase [Aequorivita capsosiphonis]|uniref:class I fructose-bisphosphate aldolase n=1 Tax=Aequorivita capsosiphonis TaxID=487317 RepID=UPI0004087AC0|nr:class I fructose-bisphosphate aldolase [Aequorivita capsosiphonis]